MIKIALIDADSLCYLGIEDIDIYKDRVDELISMMVAETKASHYKVFIEAVGNQTFRKILYPEYKANRQDRELPVNMMEIKHYIIDSLNPYVSVGVESDDSIISTYTYIKEEYPLTDVVICAMDKDYKTFPVNIFDTYHARFGELYSITEEQANKNFYIQMLMGDTSDNVKGIKGIGKVASDKIITHSLAPFIACYREYVKAHKRKAKKEFIMSYTLLKLRKDCKKCYSFDEALFEN